MPDCLWIVSVGNHLLFDYYYYTVCNLIIFCLLFIADTDDSQKILKDITQALFDHYSFHSITIQIESGEDQKQDCVFCQEPRD